MDFNFWTVGEINQGIWAQIWEHPVYVPGARKAPDHDAWLMGHECVANALLTYLHRVPHK